MLNEYVKSASDEDIGQFVKTMKTGTREEQRKLARKTYDETAKKKGILYKCHH
jgi:hypothetical protein